MNLSMRFATAFGIPLRLHWTFLALLAGILVYVGPSGWMPTTVMVVGVFGSVTLHELGHALAAKRYGIRTAHITLTPIGGVAAIEGMPRNPAQELVIALAGPAVNAALFPILLAAGWSLQSDTLLWLAIANLGMGLFNLIPAFPMDGGRVLRALLATRIGWMRASSLSIKIGTGFAWVFIAVAVVTGAWNLALIGIFLLAALSAERQRLVAHAWERARGGWTDWGSTDPWGARSVRFRWR